MGSAGSDAWSVHIQLSESADVPNGLEFVDPGVFLAVVPR